MSRNADPLFADRVEVEFGILVGTLALLILAAMVAAIRPPVIALGAAFVVGLYVTLRFLKTLERIADALERLADERNE